MNVGKLALLPLYTEYHVMDTPKYVRDAFRAHPGVRILQLAVASLLGTSAAEGAVFCLLSMHPLPEAEVRITARAYLSQFPQDAIHLARLALCPDLPILCNVKLSGMFRLGQYYHCPLLEKLIFTFGPSLQQQMDAHLTKVAQYSDCPSYYGMQRLWEEGAKLLPSAHASPAVSVEFRLWWAAQVADYQKIKMFLLFKFPLSSALPSALVEVIVGFLPWSQNVQLDEMSLYVLERLLSVEQRIAKLLSLQVI
jgi:hypothetical protein